MDKEEVIKKISKALAMKKIHSAFHPIIKEFFIRAFEQYQWTVEDLQKALDRFESLQDIHFKKMTGLEKGRNKFRVDKGKGTLNSHMAISIEYLEGILACDINKIEEFINVMIHELGHIIKMKNASNDKIEVGLQVLNAKNMQCIQGTVIDEFAEIIFALKLQKGNFLEDRYCGYPHMHSAIRATIYALGLTEEKLFYFQWEGREAYENEVVRELGEQQGKNYLFIAETILDNIHANYMMKNETEITAQAKELNSLLNRIFRERIQVLKGRKAVQHLAKLDTEQTICNIALQDMLIELGIEGKIKTGVKYSLLESQMTDDMIERVRKEGDKLLQEREERQRKEAKFYDNTQLIKEIYKSFSNYPIRLLPILSLPRIIKAKIVNERTKRERLEVPAENGDVASTLEESYLDRHRRFATKIVKLAKNDTAQMTEYIVGISRKLEETEKDRE